MTRPWSPYFDGAVETSDQTRSFSIGPWSFQYANGDVLYACYDGIEIVRRIYGALRDEAWGTLSPIIANEVVRETSNSILIEFEVRLVRDAVNFTWHGQIRAEAAGSLVYSFDGTSHSDFRCNRVGLCLLHTVDHAVNQRCRIVDGEHIETSFDFPVSIAPDNLAADIASITYLLASWTAPFSGVSVLSD